MRIRVCSFIAGAVALMLFGTSPAGAHWCDDLWISSYNLVVRPESDTVAVPASGTATARIFVQNNMGYQLPNFVLIARIGGATLMARRQSRTLGDTLLPGEKAKYEIVVAKPGGGEIRIEDISFSVTFGVPGTSNCYPTKGANAVVIVKTDGSLYPTKPLPGLDKPEQPPGCIFDLPQGLSLQYEAMADFEDVDVGLDKLLQLYCAGRGSWNVGAGRQVPYNCPDTSRTRCPTRRPATGTGEKYAYSRLWAAGELAARKSALGARLPVLRARLQCAVNDDDLGFAGYALFMLGYLGEDVGARAFAQTLAAAGGDLGTIAKAALYMMGNSADKVAYQPEVKAGLAASNFFGRIASAAALGIADKDDDAVTSVLMPGVTFTRPDESTGDQGKGMFAAHLLALVAWDRRGWAANGADKGDISFYGHDMRVSADADLGPTASAAIEGGRSSGSRGCGCNLGERGGACAFTVLVVAAMAVFSARRKTAQRDPH